MKRTFLYLLTNFAVMAVLSVVMSIVFSYTGVDRSGMMGLLVLAAIFGFGGSLISLMLSKWMALRSVGGSVITEPTNETERWIIKTVEKQADQLGIGMPTVALYQAPDMNAFATGARKNSALVALSTGLLEGMNQDEVEAVIAHEMSHIANGDMVTMTLLQGVLNTFVIFISRIIANIIVNAMNNRSLSRVAYFGVSFVLELVFGFLASFITMWYSRRREYFADAGAAKLVGKQKMIAALERLKNSHEPELEGSMMAFGINGKKTLTELLMSHPPLDKRIDALKSIL